MTVAPEPSSPILRLPLPAPGPLVLDVGRLTRTYHLHRPQGRHAGTSVPLVIVLHGGFGSGEQAERAYGWNAKSDAEGFVVCHPDGLMRAWNAGTCCGEPMRRGVDDVAFLSALLDHLERAEGLDPDRLYVTGMSNGAMMAYRLAAELPGRLAAIGPVAGTMAFRAGDVVPVSICHVHGLEDHHVPFRGGRGGRSVGQDWRRPVPDVLGEWRARAGCGAVRVSEHGRVRVETAAAPSGTEVALVTVEGAGHQWPGSTALAPRVAQALRLDPPSDAVDATALLWAFFKAHQRGA